VENILDAVKHSNSYTAFVLKEKLLLVEAAACAEACGKPPKKKPVFFFWGKFFPLSQEKLSTFISTSTYFFLSFSAKHHTCSTLPTCCASQRASLWYSCLAPVGYTEGYDAVGCAVMKTSCYKATSMRTSCFFSCSVLPYLSFTVALEKSPLRYTTSRRM